MAEIYVSTDVEADGPIPGEYSMLSVGSAAFLSDKTIVDTFSINLETLPGARQDEDTMGWWSKRPKAWEACHQNLKDPKTAMLEYAAWIKKLPGTPIFVGYPAGFDFMYVNWYLTKFTGSNPFSFIALDIKTYAHAIMKCDFSDVTKTTMPKEWFDSHNKTHVALDDAIEQGLLFCNMMAHNLKGTK